MTPAQRLRQAAQLARETATEATPGPWRHDGDGEVSVGSECVSHPFKVADAAHIALCDPPMLLAVAAWLDLAASQVENYGPNAESPWIQPHIQHGLAVADSLSGTDRCGTCGKRFDETVVDTWVIHP